MTIEEKTKAVIRDVPDFPKPGILFKDITPILENPILCREITEALARPFATKKSTQLLEWKAEASCLECCWLSTLMFHLFRCEKPENFPTKQFQPPMNWNMERR